MGALIGILSVVGCVDGLGTAKTATTSTEPPAPPINQGVAEPDSGDSDRGGESDGQETDPLDPSGPGVPAATDDGESLLLASSSTVNGTVIYKVGATSDEALGGTIPIGDTGFTAVTDIALHDGTLYAATTSELWRFTSFDAVETVGPFRTSGTVWALDSDSLGGLYGSTQASRIFTADTQTGVASEVFRENGVFTDGDIAFGPDDTAYFVSQPSVGIDGSLATLDFDNESIVEIGQLGVDNVHGLAFGYDGQLYGVTADAAGCVGNGALVSIDTDTGKASHIRCLTFNASGATRFAVDDGGEDEPLTPCPDVLILSARGSGDNQGSANDPGRHGRAVGDFIVADMGLEVEVRGVAYPAVGTPLSRSPFPGNTEIVDYHLSVDEGVEDLLDKLDQYVLVGCALQTRVVLVGYSQGADVMQRAILKLEASPIDAEVAAVVIFGSSRFSSEDHSARGDFGPNAFGVLPAVLPALEVPSSFSDRTRSYCVADDLVCEGLSTGNPIITSTVHSIGYDPGSDPMTDARAFVSHKLGVDFTAVPLGGPIVEGPWLSETSWISAGPVYSSGSPSVRFVWTARNGSTIADGPDPTVTVPKLRGDDVVALDVYFADGSRAQHVCNRNGCN